METANLADMTKNRTILYVSAKKARTTPFPRNTGVAVKSLWRETNGIFANNPWQA